MRQQPVSDRIVRFSRTHGTSDCAGVFHHALLLTESDNVISTDLISSMTHQCPEVEMILKDRTKNRRGDGLLVEGAKGRSKSSSKHLQSN